jgi:DNA methylase
MRTYEPFVPGPNPKLPEFMRQHATPYDPATDRYDVPAFERDLVVDKAAPPKAIYDMHSYWSKKHWAAIREYIRHYLPEKFYPRGTGLVLDCFSGSGMTGVAAMMEDRPCVLIDASPAAAFISHCYTHPVDPEELEAAYERMLTEPYPDELKAKLRRETGEDIGNLREELDWLYATKCDRCGGEAATEYVVYSQRFQCPNCAEVVALFDCPQENVPYPVGGRKLGKTESKKKTVCPHCLARNQGRPQRDFVISTRGKKFGAVPVLVRYCCEGGCRPAARRGQAQPQRKVFRRVRSRQDRTH